MFPKSWRRKRTPSSDSRRLERRRFRPVLEVLEERLAPATLTVNSPDDNITDTSVLTLRDAVTLVNKGGNPSSLGQTSMPSGWQNQINTFNNTQPFGNNDTILIGTVLPIVLSQMGDDTYGPSALPVTTAMTIDGALGAISGGGANSNLRLFYVSPTGSLTLNYITLSNARAPGGNGAPAWFGGGGGGAGLGGAIFNQGTLSINNCVLSGNMAVGGDGGDGDIPGRVGGGGGGGLGADGIDGFGGQPGGATPAANGFSAIPAGFGGGGGGGKVYEVFGTIFDFPTSGGFGGGGGGSPKGSLGSGVAGGGFGGGHGGAGDSSGYYGGGGGGAGMGGAIFNDGGTVTITDSGLSANTAAGGHAGGNGGHGLLGANGQGLGGAIFNLNGSLTLVNSTITGNTADKSSGVYNYTENGSSNTATAVINNSISWTPPDAIVSGTALSSAQLDATSSLGTLTYNPPATTVLAVGTHTLEATLIPSSTALFNYANFFVSLTVNAPKQTPTVNLTANNSIYNGSAYTVNAVNVAGQNNTTIASLTADPSTLSFTWYKGTATSGTNLGSNAPKDAGTYTVVAHYTSDNASYTNADSTPQTFTITPKTLLVTGLSATNKTYDATNADPLSGTAALLAAEAAGAGSSSDGKPYTGDTVMLGGTAVGTLSQKDVGTGLAVSVSGNTLTGAQAIDYVLASNEESGLTANTTAKTLLMSGLSATNKIYDGTSSDPLSGTAALLAAEAAGSGTTGDGKPYSGDTLLLGGTAVGSFAQKDVGTGLAVSVSGNTLTGAQAIDYVLATNEESGLTANITAKTLLVSGLSATNKIYDATTTDPLSGTAALLAAEAAGSGSTSDGKPYTGDTVMLGGTAVGTLASKDVGSGIAVMVNGNSLSGSQVNDYVLAANEQSGLTATITPKALTYSGLSVPANRPYNGNTNAVVSGTAVLQTAESPGAGSTSDSKPYSGDAVGLTGTPTGTYNSKDVATAASVIFGGLSLTGANNADYSLTAGTQPATITPQTVTASIIGNPTKPYDGTTSATLTPANFSLSGLAGTESFTVTQTSGVYNSPNVATATTVTASLTAGNFTPANGTLASNYTLPSTASGPGQITQASLSASGDNFSATAGAPFSGTVATFTTSDTADGAGAFTATITWGDGKSSSGSVTPNSAGKFTVSGSHTYADPNASPGYAVSVQISNPNTKSGTANDTAIVTSLGQNVGKGLAAGIGFWQNQNGRALIHSFGSTASGQTLANWLATTFPNLYGPGTGSNDLTNKTNDQVAAYYLTLFNLSGPKAQAEVLATALNVYATTTTLGSSKGAAYGFSVSAAGLGAYSFNVGSDGAAFGVANNTTQNVDELLLAVNKQASNGSLYSGSPMQSTLQGQAADLFDALNQAGGIP
jgi:hypothetical protein